MRLTRLLLCASAAISFGTLTLSPAQAVAADSSPYTVLDPAQPSDTAGKVEVLEFYAYGCPYCNAFQPFLEKWVKTLPPNVVFHPVPVDIDAGGAALQKLYYTLQSMGRLDLHDAVFKAIHEEHKPLFDAKAIGDWLATKGVDRAKFEATFNSFGVQTKVKRAIELSTAYHIEGTPTLAIGGQYLTSPSQANGYQAAIVEAQKLLEKVLKK